MAGAATEQSNFESGIAGIVNKFGFWSHFRSPSKELLQTDNDKKDFWTIFETEVIILTIISSTDGKEGNMLG